MEAGKFKEAPLETGFELPNGETLPFRHVMFEQIDVNAGSG